MSRSIELFNELWSRALPRYHPAVLCANALVHNPAVPMTLADPAVWRLAETLVDAADEFAQNLQSLYRGRYVVPCCLVCGSELCPTYQGQFALTPVALVAMEQQLGGGS